MMYINLAGRECSKYTQAISVSASLQLGVWYTTDMDSSSNYQPLGSQIPSLTGCCDIAVTLLIFAQFHSFIFIKTFSIIFHLVNIIHLVSIFYYFVSDSFNS